MVGYIEDLDLINVSDILNNVSLNNSGRSPSTHDRLMNASSSTRIRNTPSSSESQLLMHPDLQNYKNVREYENDEKFDATLSDTGEYNSMSIPNPVGYLQELCVKKGFGLPVYGILNQDGPAHEPTFSTFCHVQEPNREHYRVAISNSKKRGKEIASREVIMSIRKSMDFDSANRTVVPINNDTVQNIPPEISTAKARTMNYVGCLQELCVRKQLPPPNYGTEKSTGTPNNPSFYIFCEVGPHKEVGIASNKKSAKQLAAEKVLGLLEMLKTTNDSYFKESTQAENNETLQNTLNIKDIQVLSDTALETFTVIPNPVGHLQELCVKYRLRPPVYEVVQVDGPPHCPTFTTLCRVANLCQEACSSNKKRGKEIAASKILKCLIEHHKSATKE